MDAVLENRWRRPSLCGVDVVPKINRFRARRPIAVDKQARPKVLSERS